MSRARRPVVIETEADDIAKLEEAWVREQFRPNPDHAKMDELRDRINELGGRW